MGLGIATGTDRKARLGNQPRRAFRLAIPVLMPTGIPGGSRRYRVSSTSVVPSTSVAVQRPLTPFFAPQYIRTMRTILVVDDSPTMRRMIMAALRELGDVAFDQAGSGLEAIERLAVSPVDLVVLDLNMPDVHGLEVLRFVRSHDRFRS